VNKTPLIKKGDWSDHHEHVEMTQKDHKGFWKIRFVENLINMNI